MVAGAAPPGNPIWCFRCSVATATTACFSFFWQSRIVFASSMTLSTSRDVRRVLAWEAAQVREAGAIFAGRDLVLPGRNTDVGRVPALPERLRQAPDAPAPLKLFMFTFADDP